MFRLALATTALLSLGACSTYQTRPALDIPAVQDGQIAQATMVDLTREMSSDAFEGRMPGSVGEEKTVALLSQRFKAAGLEPGNKGSWVQKVPLVEITGRDFAPLTIKGKGADLAFQYQTDWVGSTYREDARTELKNSELVFVGYGIVAPEKGWNDYAGIDMRGKTAVILVNDPDFNTAGLDGPFGGKAMTYYGRWTYKYEEAARQGAAADAGQRLGPEGRGGKDRQRRRAGSGRAVRRRHTARVQGRAAGPDRLDQLCERHPQV